MDLPDHGRTAAAFGEQPYDFKAMGEDVLHTLSMLQISRAHLLGHSAGGKVVASASLSAQQMQMQMQPPPKDRVDILSTTLMDISPIHYDPAEPEFSHVVATVEFLAKSSAAMRLAKSKTEAFSIIASSIPDRSLGLFLQASLQPIGTGDGGFEWKFNVPGIKASLDAIVGWPYDDPIVPLQRPVLLIKGSKSNFVKSSHLPEIATKFPLFTLASVDAGHWLHVEKPSEVVDLVANFIFQVMAWHAEQSTVRGSH